MADRVRFAMLFCFAGALGLFALLLTTRREELAPLAIAFWIVAMLLALPVVYYRARQR